VGAAVILVVGILITLLAAVVTVVIPGVSWFWTLGMLGEVMLEVLLTVWLASLVPPQEAQPRVDPITMPPASTRAVDLRSEEDRRLAPMPGT